MPPHDAAPHDQCPICAELGNYARAFQKGGRAGEDTYLPASSNRLRRVREVNSFSTLRQCPECQTFYLYKSYYDYYVSGGEEEQILIRLKDETEAEKYADYWLR